MQQRSGQEFADRTNLEHRRGPWSDRAPFLDASIPLGEHPSVFIDTDDDAGKQSALHHLVDFSINRSFKVLFVRRVAHPMPQEKECKQHQTEEQSEDEHEKF